MSQVPRRTAVDMGAFVPLCTYFRYCEFISYTILNAKILKLKHSLIVETISQIVTHNQVHQYRTRVRSDLSRKTYVTNFEASSPHSEKHRRENRQQDTAAGVRSSTALIDSACFEITCYDLEVSTS